MVSDIFFITFYIIGMFSVAFVPYDWYKFGLGNKSRLGVRYATISIACVFFAISFLFYGELQLAISYVIMSSLCMGIHFLYKNEKN